MTRLQTLTLELLALVHEANSIYYQVREKKENADFYSEVKPFADRVHALSKEWETEALDWLKQAKAKPKYLHMPQIKATVENLELVSVQAFYYQTSLTRFKNYIESTLFVLNQLAKETE
ncbi:hypothetical protein JOC78_000893 [Bacillus ectoiniformans]|uniref:YppE family protein n=1 Tax=Bacillus ectoiniformans TaxID=1494429 RepID=UPI0019563023|nr:YppE family protein [Bacillus ectoiniformans]MBM7647953.1 hypothetical protein [Bacillus ectoiniformans]